MSTPEPATETAVVCLPFAGAGASFFHPWTARAAAGLRIVPVRLPGRERLIDDEPYRDVASAVDGVLAQVRAETAGAAQVVLFGHSLGAVLAFELTRRLAAESGPPVRRLFASGAPAPHLTRSGRATGLSDDEFVARVREFAGFTDEALDDPELRELILPTLRADVEMHENYRPATDAALPVPVTAIRAVGDELLTAAEAAAWSGVSAPGFAFVEPPGGHMYLTEATDWLLGLIAAAAADDDVAVPASVH